MSSKASRAKRQAKRAEKFQRGLARQEDIDTIIGLSINDAFFYLADKSLLMNIRSTDGLKNEDKNYAGPNIINVDVIAGKIAKARTSTRRLDNGK